VDDDCATLDENSLISTDLVRSCPARRKHRRGIFERSIDFRA
jgi:hypothetical protein